MEALIEVPAHCPHCDASISLLIDTSAGGQDYIEDCEVCCSPMRVLVDANFSVTLLPES